MTPLPRLRNYQSTKVNTVKGPAVINTHGAPQKSAAVFQVHFFEAPQNLKTPAAPVVRDRKAEAPQKSAAAVFQVHFVTRVQHSMRCECPHRGKQARGRERACAWESERVVPTLRFSRTGRTYCQSPKKSEKERKGESPSALPSHGSVRRAFPRIQGALQDLRERECCLLVLNLVSSTLSCIRRLRPRLLVLDVCGFV